jgi:hypothetical protein
LMSIPLVFLFSRVRLTSMLCLLGAICGVASAVAATGDAPVIGGTQVAYRLDKSAFVTLVIEDADGRRVRNLVSGVWREAGDLSERWDGFNDSGEPVPAGPYRWRGIVHDGLSTHFVGAFNSPGNPPWPTAQVPAQRNIRVGGNGGWLSDHERPVCAYADGDRIYFGAEIAEAGHSIMALDLDGNKQWGTLWLGLSGASAIARDGDILYVAGEKGWMKDSLAVSRLDPNTHRWIPNPTGPAFRADEPQFIKVKSAEFSGIQGMAITDKWIVLSLADKNRLACFSLQDGSHVKDVDLPGAGALLKHRDGRILAVSGSDVVVVDLENGKHRALISGQLGRAGGIAVSSKNEIFVSDAAEAEQCIKVFSEAGVLLRRIGRTGGRREGRFDPQAMAYPKAIAIDARDQVWVGEHSFLPKRISRWTTQGGLVVDYIGPSYYGGGGTLDPRDARRAFYKGMEFELVDWPKTSTLRNILFRPEEHGSLPWRSIEDVRKESGLKEGNYYGRLPQAPVLRNDRLYLLNDEGYGVRSILIGEYRGDRLKPRAVYGNYYSLWQAWKNVQPDYIKSVFPSEPAVNAPGVFLWQDANGDGEADPSEITLEPEWVFGAQWSMRSFPTLNLHARRGDRLMVVAPIAEADELTYDLTQAKAIPLPEIVLKRGFSALAPDLDGNVIINVGGGDNQGDSTNVILSMSNEGRVLWTYPNPYPSNWHNSPRARVGNIQHTLNVEGVVPLDGDAGALFQLNGNKGVRYLFTTDGLFLAELYGDMRIKPLISSLAVATAGMRMDQNSLGDETFSGWIGHAPDGRVLQIVGKESSNVMEVRGVNSLRRLVGGDLTLSETATARAGGGVVAPTPVEAVQLGGIPVGWHKVSERSFPPVDPVGKFAIGYQPQVLHLYVEVEKPEDFANAGADVRTLFRTGDSVDFRLAARTNAPSGRTTPAEGDQRWVFSLFEGKPVAVRYRYVVPGVAEDKKAKFASPTGVAVVDDVSVRPEVTVKIEKTGKGWRLTARIPWTSLGLIKAPVGEVRGDIGVTLADAAGTRTVARYYYFDTQSQVVSDLPSEVRVNPSAWGVLSF